MRNATILLWTIVALACAGCLLGRGERDPCRRCEIECDDGPRACEACREEECPDFAEE